MESQWDKSHAEQRDITIKLKDFVSAVTRSRREFLYSGKLVLACPNDVWEFACMSKYYDVLEICGLCIGWLYLLGSDNLHAKFDSANLVSFLATLFAVSGFELLDIIEILCSRHLFFYA